MKTRTFVSILILILAVMIVTGSSVTASDTEVLFKSVRSGDYAEVKRLIGIGVDVSAQDKMGYTALILASINGHAEVVKLLIDAGADVNAKGVAGYTAIISASYHGQYEVAQLLIEEGADVNARNKGGSTALIEAS